MNITLQINRKGHAHGTLGWLCENAHEIRIGTSRGGAQCAWLLNRSGGSVCLLVIRGICDGDNHIYRSTRESDCDELYVDRMFTDAAWSVIKKIQAVAIAEMERGESADDAREISVAVGAQ